MILAIFDGVVVDFFFGFFFIGQLEQLKHGKKEEKAIAKGRECGMAFEDGFEGFESGDKILGVEKYEVPRTLSDGF